MRMVLVLGVLAGCAGVGSDVMDVDSMTPTPVAVEAADGFGLHDGAGPVAGMAAFSVERTPDATRCGGVAVRVVRDASVAVAAADQPLAHFLAMEYPLGLDFGDATKAASLNKFQDWVTEAKQRGETAVAAYNAQIAAATDLGAQAAATARLVQVSRMFAGMLMRAEIPVDMRSGEYAEDKQAAFCDALAQVAQPLLARADDHVTECARRAEKLPAGWWTPVCTH